MPTTATETGFGSRPLDGTTLYQYDALNQLQRVDYPAYSEELFYDKAGNRARRLVGGEEELYQYDPRNRLMALTRGGVTTPFQYDNAGNLLQDDKQRYSYDAFNRTVKVETFDGNVQVNRYDAEGLRHEMEENGRLVRFIFHKGEAVVEHEENSNVIRLIRGSELIARSSDSESAGRTTTTPATRWGQPPTSLTKAAMCKTATPTTPGERLRSRRSRPQPLYLLMVSRSTHHPAVLPADPVLQPGYWSLYSGGHLPE